MGKNTNVLQGAKSELLLILFAIKSSFSCHLYIQGTIKPFRVFVNYSGANRILIGTIHPKERKVYK